MNTFAHTISPSAIAAMDGVRVKSTAQHMVLEGMKDLAVLEAPDPNSTPPERRPGRAGGTLKAPARAGPAPRTPANGGVMPLRNWPHPYSR